VASEKAVRTRVAGRGRRGWAVLLALALLAAGGARAAPNGAGYRELVVVATSDLHGWVTSRAVRPERRGRGLAHLAPLIARLRAAHPELILLDAGDAVTGSPDLELLPPGVTPPILALMGRLGYDALTLGNHDLERGRVAVERWRAATPFSWLAANVTVTAPDGRAAPWLAPYAMVERAGLRVAVLGLTTPGIPIWLAPEDRAGLAFGDMTAAARRWVPRLREDERADVVIGLFHAGLDGDYDRDVALRHGVPLPNAAGEVTDAVPGLDLVVAGHSHRLGPHRLEAGPEDYRVPILQPGARGNAVAVARLGLRRRAGRWAVVSALRWTLRAAAEPAPLPPEVAAPLARVAEALAAPTALRFTAEPTREAFAACAGALSHTAALAQPLPPGGTALTGGGAPFSLLPALWRREFPRDVVAGPPVRRRDLHRWIAYDNALVLAALTGRQIELLAAPYARHLRGMGGRRSAVLFPGGLTLAPGEGDEPEGRVLGPAGRPLAPHRRYAVWLTDYHWNGGAGLARQALLHPSQRLGTAPVRLRAALLSRLTDPALSLPPACASFLAPAGR